MQKKRAIRIPLMSLLGINYIVSVINRCKVNKSDTLMTQSYYLLAIIELIPFGFSLSVSFNSS